MFGTSLNAVDFAKTIAIILTAGFGVCGALTESRDKETGRLTRWGKVSIAGIVVSAMIGSIIQVAEANAAKRKSDAEAVEARMLITNTRATLQQVERSLSRFGPRPPFFLNVSGDCRESVWRRFCAALPRHVYDAHVPSAALAALRTDVANFTVTIKRPGEPYRSTRPDATYHATVALSPANEAVRFSTIEHNRFTLFMTGSMTVSLGKGALSFDDLRGYHLYFYSGAPFLHLDLEQFSITAENGKQIYTEGEWVHPVSDAADRVPASLNFDYPIPEDR